MDTLIYAPLIIPLLCGLLALVRNRAVRRRTLLLGLFANMLACIYLLGSTWNGEMLVSQAGGHAAPYGISVVVDSLSAMMLAITGIIGFSIALFSRVTIDARRERFAYYPLLAFLIMGINFAFITGDLFTLYVSFEVMLMASFVLLTLGGEKVQLEGGIKYVTLNLISSTVFLIAAGLTYSVVGTLNMAHLSQRLTDVSTPGITTVLAGLFFFAFGIKAAIFPLFFWLPASYHTPPVAVTAMIGGLLTKVGIYSMWRVLVFIFPDDLLYLQPLVLTIAGLTMVIGVLGAVAQTNFRRLLSFHIISQIGYLLMGTALLTSLSLTGAVFFMIHVILAKTALFLVSGIAYSLQGSYQLKKMGGLKKSHPFVALLFLLAALSLAGIPPLPGFWAKLTLIRAGLEAGQFGIVLVALMVSLLTLYSMVKIWNEAFWKDYPGALKVPDLKPLKPIQLRAMLLPTSTLVALILLMGTLAEPVYQLSHRAANNLINRPAYIQSVLQGDIP